MAASERRRELKRRRTRREKLAVWKRRLEKANQSEKAEIVRKLRELTPGAEIVIDNWELGEVDR